MKTIRLIGSIEKNFGALIDDFKGEITRLNGTIAALEEIVGIIYDIIESGKKVLCKKLDIDPKYLKYSGVMKTHDGRDLLHYNVLDTKHSKYKSTVTCYAK